MRRGSPPNAHVGLVQPTSSVHYHFDGLFITEENVGSLLVLSRKPNSKLSLSSEDAHHLIECLRRPDELIVTSQHVLNELEDMWTGRRRPFNSSFYSASEVEVYAVLEYRCFIDESWNIIRQLTCLSVSETAFRALVKSASHLGPQPQPLSNISRGCPSTVVYESIECLLSDSPQQILHSAIASTMLSLRPGPVRDGAVSAVSLIKFLDFSSISRSWIGRTVYKYSSLAKKQPPKGRLQSALSSQLRRGRGKLHVQHENWLCQYRQKTADRSFERRSTRIADPSANDHSPSSCARCTQFNEKRVEDLKRRKVSENFLVPGHLSGTDRLWPAPWEPINVSPSAHNTVLVHGTKDKTTETTETTSQPRHNYCLFTLGDQLSLSDDPTRLIDVVKAHYETGLLYNTTFQDLRPCQADKSKASDPGWYIPTIVNHPSQYVRFSTDESSDLEDWLWQLRGERVEIQPENTTLVKGVARPRGTTTRGVGTRLQSASGTEAHPGIPARAIRLL
ncbi:hypothetical protein F4802DRAFT_291941 [Xylaria palmicola]|nr:hypothetical protein F4802DRAFT_291941 [Xylaria palmicola]